MNHFKLVLLALISLSMAACSDEHSSEKNRIEKPIAGKRFDKDLPFGDTSLLSEYPTAFNDKHPKNLTKHIPVKYSFLERIFEKLNAVKSIKAPEIKKISYEIIGADSLFCRDTAHFFKDFKYHLPPIGPYECYYQYGDFFNGRALPDSLRNYGYDCLDHGNVVLYDQKTHSAKVINVFSNYNQPEFLTIHRVFLITKDQHIHLFDFDEIETGIYLNDYREIIVTKNGEILKKVYQAQN